MKETTSVQFSKANRVIAGGVNSPVRAWKSVGGHPRFVLKAKGSRIYDTLGKAYIDYVLSWGPMILGHAHPDVTAAVRVALKQGTSFGAPTLLETAIAEMISSALPSIERIRMTSSGTEAAMTAIRLARGYTGRKLIVKFDGCYHGHSDSVLIKAGSGPTTLGIPGSPGVPDDIARLTLSLPYNDTIALAKTVKRYGSQLAAVIVEPVAGNMGVVAPREEFLKQLRVLTAKNGIVLIYDEVITGFRFTFGGYQNLVGITPDLTCLGKIIGGGLPVGAIGGRKKIMERLAPTGDVYQAGTLSGNPVAMIAGLTTLQLLKAKKKSFASLDKKTDQLCRAMHEMFFKKGIPVCINRVFSMFTVFFQEGPVVDLQTALKSDTNMFARFFRGMLKNGIWLAPSQYEAGFLSFAHTEKDLQKTLQACAKTLRNL
ncbi:MAG TPA: glutamate-1-semialdehyde 2,1-aminomutase [Smithella sp.]|jgi:glutamate-1-semialdehyde 2,1-aminomutase|nr:glutamate-1-semialdehyde 2,1-aminomutase [Smithella sp.]HOO34936.1 glutamate-1-semialdehyde 2,1-aminomutase [Smithella sp.]HOS13852.1 glutamate-1-semialdehyde 2,1-aminomutase [Smithella sp.]HPK21875.1 glutamate-1-semialdehyde 2,1-aminomutase [Smithella sp.]HPL46583.1 glutamate-1-semialdehyde 2,1-aminomutase [Smithella sp.]